MNGCHIHVLQACTGVSAFCLYDFACIVVVIELTIPFSFSNSGPIPFEKGIWDDAMFDDWARVGATRFVLSPEGKRGIGRDRRGPSCVSKNMWESVVGNFELAYIWIHVAYGVQMFTLPGCVWESASVLAAHQATVGVV